VTRHDESEDEQRHMGASDRGENGEEALTTGERGGRWSGVVPNLSRIFTFGSRSAPSH
jgi:hypothetical protein